MKLAVSYDAEGTILTMFDPEKLRGEKATLQYIPAEGERHHVIDLPKEMEGEPFMELHKRLRVNAKSASPKFERK
jgi:hypothetical protein